MILECCVVKDLFVLYKENELSPEVREAVDNHLESCEECKNQYESESGFVDVFHNVEMEVASKKVDDRICMVMRIRQLKGIVIVIVLALVIYSYFHYLDTRRNLLMSLEQLMGSIYHVQVSVESANFGEDDFSIDLGDKLELIQQQHQLLERDLNFFERQNLNKNEGRPFINYKIGNLANLLQDRRHYGKWEKNDQLAYDQMTGYFKELVSAMQKDIDKLRRTRDSSTLNPSFLFQTYDLSYIRELYAKLNKLSVCYIDYGKLPEDTNILSDSEIKKIIASKLGTDIKIEIRDIPRRNLSMFDFHYDLVEVKYPGKDYTSSISVDAVTGDIYNMNTIKNKYEGEIIPLETIEKSMEEKVKRLYGSEFDYKISYKGINYNYSSNIPGFKNYSFDVKPYYKGYQVYINANEDILHIDAYEGVIDGFFELRRPSAEMIGTSSGSILDSKECLERNSRKIAIENYTYVKTIYKYSRITGKYELMHFYNDTKTSREIYINALENAGVME